MEQETPLLKEKRKELQTLSHNLAIEAYTLVLQFPKFETMVMILSARRLSLSIVLNTAKGFACKDEKDSLFFLSYANASCSGLKSLFEMAKDIGYVTEEQVSSIQVKSLNLKEELRGVIKRIEIKRLSKLKHQKMNKK